jgi:hypothetical protein
VNVTPVDSKSKEEHAAQFNAATIGIEEIETARHGD